MDEYLERIEAAIKGEKTRIIAKADRIGAELVELSRLLRGCLDDPTQSIVNRLGELQGDAVTFNANCGRLGTLVEQREIYLSTKKGECRRESCSP